MNPEIVFAIINNPINKNIFIINTEFNRVQPPPNASDWETNTGDLVADNNGNNIYFQLS